ncbi:hypothetical protein CPB83DRAFT_906442 [Crepidotus variabilis]|uniref:RING-type domain-containing protein n=1 Tax=Crepidotus variabilis TaxID=179855 RepID=A0A9P6JQP1_9AGAR|nr:hypothetical protein CPB83DRAFT_906442 [Crepidotus variabilis]
MSAANCSICFSDYLLDVDKFAIFPCGHGFCKACINKLFAQSRMGQKCPQCRKTVHKKDAHPIHLEIISPHTYLQTSVTEELERMGPNASLQTVKETNDKLEKILQESKLEGDNILSLLKAVEEFKERIVPMFSQADSQKRQLESMHADMLRLRHEKELLLQKIRRIEEKQPYTAHLTSSPVSLQPPTQSSSVTSETLRDEVMRIPLEYVRGWMMKKGLGHLEPSSLGPNDKIRMIMAWQQINLARHHSQLPSQGVKRRFASLDDNDSRISPHQERKRSRGMSNEYPNPYVQQYAAPRPVMSVPSGYIASGVQPTMLPPPPNFVFDLEASYQQQRLPSAIEHNAPRAGPSNQPLRSSPADILPVTLPPIRRLSSGSQSRPIHLPRMAFQPLDNSSRGVDGHSMTPVLLRMPQYDPTPVVTPSSRIVEQNRQSHSDTIPRPSESTSSNYSAAYAIGRRPAHPSQRSRELQESDGRLDASTSAPSQDQGRTVPTHNGGSTAEAGSSRIAPLSPPPAQRTQPQQSQLMNSMPSMPMNRMNLSGDLSMFDPEFMGMDTFDAIFKTDGDINFEREFGQWFTQTDDPSSS